MAKYQVAGNNRAGRVVKVQVVAPSAKEAFKEGEDMGLSVAEVNLMEDHKPAEAEAQTQTAPAPGKPSTLNMVMRLILMGVIGLCFLAGFMDAIRSNTDLSTGFLRGLVMAIIPGLLLGLLYVKRVF